MQKNNEMFSEENGNQVYSLGSQTLQIGGKK